MNRVIQLALAVLMSASFMSCAKTERVVEETYPDGSEKLVKTYKVKGDEKELIEEISFYPNGYKQYEGEYKEGERHGEWVYWYDNGVVWSEGFFENGESHGMRIGYHKNGQKYFEGEYDKGKQIGTWYFWDENGELVKEEKY